jgi:hypothetical protein
MLETLLFWRLKVAKKPHLRDLTLGVSSIVWWEFSENMN